MRHGMYRGTRFTMNCGPKRCNAPKTASGAAKHAVPRATTLSAPRAAANTFLAADAPIANTARPNAHIAVAVGESSRLASMVDGAVRHHLSPPFFCGPRRGPITTPAAVQQATFGISPPVEGVRR